MHGRAHEAVHKIAPDSLSTSYFTGSAFIRDFNDHVERVRNYSCRGNLSGHGFLLWGYEGLREDQD